MYLKHLEHDDPNAQKAEPTAEKVGKIHKENPAIAAGFSGYSFLNQSFDCARLSRS